MANITTRSFNKTNSCSSNRAFVYQDDIHDTNKKADFYRSIICRDTVRLALQNHILSKSAIAQYMDNRYRFCGFKQLQEQKIKVLGDCRRVMRYVMSENRIPSFPEAKDVMVGNIKTTVAPDFSFDKGVDGIEYVFVKTGEPFATQKQKEMNPAMLMLYAAILRGRQEGYHNITASYYFLKNPSDTSNWAKCPQFFDSSQVISLNDIYQNEKNDLDDQMAKAVEGFAAGTDSDRMCEKDCKFCVNKDICKYTLPPVTTEEEVKTSEDVAMESGNTEPPVINYSAEQQEVIDSDTGVIRVIAAAGSGKTQTLAGRVAKLIENGTEPSKILCITFSDAGVKEMRRKIERIIGASAEEIKITTFHALNFEICKDNFAKLGYKRNLVVIDDVQKYGIIDDLLRKYPIPEWQGKAFLNYGVVSNGKGIPGALSVVESIFNQIKEENYDYTAIDHLMINYDPIAICSKAVDKVIKLYGKYDDICHAKGLINFDDMETLAARVIEDDPDYLDSVYDFEHIIVDEFQDTSAGQMDFVKHLKMLKSFKSLMVVGDDAQSIYGFRGTSPNFIINFPAEVNSDCLDGTTVRQDTVKDVQLTQNYRSKQEILDFAGNVLALNRNQIDKHVTAFREGNAKIECKGFIKSSSEYEWIAEKIVKLHEIGAKYEDIAVLAYTKSELRKIADALTKKGVPSMFGAPQPMLENSRIRAILAFARVIQNETDTKDASICANALYKARDVESETPFMELALPEITSRVNEVLAKAKAIRNSLNPKKQKDDFIKFCEEISLGDEMVQKFSEQFENKMLEDILTYCADFDDFGAKQEFRSLGEYPGVKLITAHSSKGLEWKTVFFTVNGIKNARKQGSEESRRLEFVAMTRARDSLYVTGLYFESMSNVGDLADNKILREIFEVNDQPWDPATAMAEETTKAKPKEKKK